MNSIAQQNLVSIVRVTATQWDAKLPCFEGQTFFDTAHWQEAFRYKVKDIHYVHFYYKGKCIAGFSCGECHQDGVIRFKSPFSAAIGGILAIPHVRLSQWDIIVNSLIQYLKEQANGSCYKVHYIRRSRLILSERPQEAEDFALLQKGFHLDSFACDLFLDLSQPVKLTSRYAGQLRKAERDNILKFSVSHVDNFLSFRSEMVEKQGKRITVPDEEIRSGANLLPEHIRFYEVTAQDVRVAVLLEDRLHKQCSIGRNWFMDKTAHKQAIHLFLLSSWIKHLHTEEIRFAGFGSMDMNISIANSGTLFFKERFCSLIYDAKKVYTFNG